MGPQLEQGPGDVEDDAAVLGPNRLRERRRVSQEGPLPRRLEHLERRKIGDPFGEGVAVGPIGVRGARPDRRDVDGVTGFVKPP